MLVKIAEGKCLVVDNVTLSNFACIGRLDILIGMTDQGLFTSQEVIDETIRGLRRTDLPHLEKIVNCANSRLIKVETCSVIDNLLLMGRLEQIKKEGVRVLGKGEVSTIPLAAELGGYFISDDKNAKLAAIDNDVPVLDTVELRDTVFILKSYRDLGEITELELIEYFDKLERYNDFTVR